MSEAARADQEWLCAHVLGTTRERIAGRTLSPAQQVQYQALLARREAGEPLAYILGEWEFWSLTLKVTPDVLIPRPDTELLVEWALAVVGAGHARDSGRASPAGPAPAVLDLGTGSGAIALALARELPAARVTAIDLSLAALKVAEENAQELRLTNVEFHQAEFLSALDTRFRGNDEPFDLIVSNPPYVAEGDPHLADLTHEPALALTAGRDGLTHLRTIIAKSPVRLSKGGWLLVEHGYDQAAAVRELFAQARFVDVQTRRDLAGHERATGGRIA